MLAKSLLEILKDSSMEQIGGHGKGGSTKRERTWWERRRVVGVMNTTGIEKKQRLRNIERGFGNKTKSR